MKNRVVVTIQSNFLFSLFRVPRHQQDPRMLNLAPSHLQPFRQLFHLRLFHYRHPKRRLIRQHRGQVLLSFRPFRQVRIRQRPKVPRRPLSPATNRRCYHFARLLCPRSLRPFCRVLRGLNLAKMRVVL